MYWEGLQVKEMWTLPDNIKSDTTKSASWIIDKAEQKQVKRSNILLDEDGVGGGVVDQVGCKGFINNATPVQPEGARFDDAKRVNYTNLKTQCYYELAQRMNDGEVGIGDHVTTSDEKTEIAEELESIKEKNIGKDGKRAIIGKDEIKEHLGRSPDYADTLMMRMYYEINKTAEPKIRTL